MVNAPQHIWDRLIARLQEAPVEIKTVPGNKREPLWFYVGTKNRNLYVYNARNHKPSVQMSQPRRISKDEFLTVYPYYQRWAKGEGHVRQEARSYSMNTAYIFGLIAHFEKNKKKVCYYL